MTYEQVVIPIRVSADGFEVDLSAVEPELRGTISDVMIEMRHRLLGREIKRWVTPQIAHEVLSVYGDERATAPSLSTQSLITLIRTCHISDDAMLAALDDVEGFHGYVLAVCLLAENRDDAAGMALLRSLAELYSDDDLAEMEKLCQKVRD